MSNLGESIPKKSISRSAIGKALASNMKAFHRFKIQGQQSDHMHRDQPGNSSSEDDQNSSSEASQDSTESWKACPEAQELFVNSNNINLETNYTLRDLLVGNTKPLLKKQRLDISPIVFLRLNTKTKGKTDVITIKALLDTGATGATATLVAADHFKNLKLNSNTTTKWKTTAGDFQTGKTAKIEFTIPEMHQNRLVTKKFMLPLLTWVMT